MSDTARIEQLDQRLLDLLARRFKESLALAKRTNGQETASSDDRVEALGQAGAAHGLERDVVVSLFRDLFAYFRTSEQAVVESEKRREEKRPASRPSGPPLTNDERQRTRRRLTTPACRFLPKESKAVIAARKPIQRDLNLGEIYGGFFKDMPTNKKGFSLFVVLANEGATVKVAPILKPAQAGEEGIRVPPIQDFAGAVAVDQACSIDKRLLRKKMGALDQDAVNSIQFALLGRTVRAI